MMATKMAVCCHGSPRSTALRSVLLGALLVCLSVAVMAETFVHAEGEQESLSGLEMLRSRASPLSAAQIRRADEDVENASKAVEKLGKVTSVLKAAGLGSISASIASISVALGLGVKDWRDSKDVTKGDANGSFQGYSKKTKAAAALGLLLFVGGGIAAISSLATDFSKGKKLENELKVANQKSTALKELMLESLVDNEAGDIDGTGYDTVA